MSARNLAILSFCQLISATGSIVMVTIGGIVGASLASNAGLATLPVSLLVVGIAAMTIPAALLMQRLGRKTGFFIASLSALGACLLCALAIQSTNFWLFCVAAFLLGINAAFTQQYRFAATESVDSEFAGRAISIVLLGAIGGAFVGPELIKISTGMNAEEPFRNVFYLVAALYGLQAVLLLGLGKFHPPPVAEARREARPMSVVIRQPVFVVSVLAGTAGYGVMAFIMTATPISMHVHDGFSIEATSSVIRSHVLGMYVPSLIAGVLIDRYGYPKVMTAGALALLAACITGFYDKSYMHYMAALILLGVGWNFLFVGATTTLTRTYRQAERFRAQAVNDFSVFGMSALGSLLAGTILHTFGWFWVILVPIPILVLVLVALFIVRHDPLMHPARIKTETATEGQP